MKKTFVQTEKSAPDAEIGNVENANIITQKKPPSKLSANNNTPSTTSKWPNLSSTNGHQSENKNNNKNKEKAFTSSGKFSSNKKSSPKQEKKIDPFKKIKEPTFSKPKFVFESSSYIISQFIQGDLLHDDDFLGGQWYNCIPNFPDWTGSGDAKADITATPAKKKKKSKENDEQKVSVFSDWDQARWKAEADACLHAATIAYSKGKRGKRNASNRSSPNPINVGNSMEDTGEKDGNARLWFMKETAKKATALDRISMLTLNIQESPIHHLEHLNELLSVLEQNSRRHHSMIVSALKDLFIHDLLPNRTLLSFQDFASKYLVASDNVSQQQVAFYHQHITKRHLLYAAFESHLKDMYQRFLLFIANHLKDLLSFMKNLLIGVAADLLKEKPEGEKLLLNMLVNKLGDPERKIATKTAYCLGRGGVLRKHPAMTNIVVDYVERFIKRDNIGMKAQYYAVVFLTQIDFRNSTDSQLAKKLFYLYVALFEELFENTRSITEDETHHAKFISALLHGINKVLPKADISAEDSTIISKIEILFRVTHSPSFSVSVQALVFLFHISSIKTDFQDRFYRSLYSRMLPGPWLDTPSKHAAFLNLIYRAMKTDHNLCRIKAYAKRLLQSALCGSTAFAAGALLVISEVMVVEKKGLLKTYITISEFGDEIETFRDADVSNDSSSSDSESKSKAEATQKMFYDPSARDPRYSKADQTSLWEINLLASHYNPSIRVFANTLLQQCAKINYQGDPLIDFSFKSFLERMCFKKIKRKTAFGQTVRPTADSREFLQLIRAGTVQVNDKFFEKFFEGKAASAIDEDEIKRKSYKALDDEFDDIDGDDGKDSDIDEDDDEDELDAAFDEILKKEFAGSNMFDDSDGLGSDDDAMAEALSGAYSDSSDVDNIDQEPVDKAKSKKKKRKNKTQDLEDSAIDLNELALEGEDFKTFIDGDDEKLDDADDFSFDSDIPENVVEVKESKRSSKRKRKKDQTDSVFAPAEEYEDVLNEIDALTRQDELDALNDNNENSTGKKRNKKRGKK